MLNSESEIAQSCPTLCDPMDCSLPGFSVHGIFQARILEWGAIAFSQGIFPTQGSNLGLPHCRQTLYPLSHQGSPITSALSIFSCASWPSVCLPWRNTCLGLLVIIWLGCLFLDTELHELFLLFWRLILCCFFANIFSHSEGCLFILYMVSFAMLNL